MKRKLLLISFVLSTSIALTACGNKADSKNVVAIKTIESATEPTKKTSIRTTTRAIRKSPEELWAKEVENIKSIEAPETIEFVETASTTDSQGWNENRTASNSAELEQNYQDARNSWTKKATWTASNGVVIKINDAWADIVTSGKLKGGGSGAAIYYDGTEDLAPNSDFMNAYNEFIYSDEAYLNGTDRFNPAIVDISKLPDVPCASSKQTSIPDSADFENYKSAFNEMYGFQVSGKWGANPAYCLQNYRSGVGLVSMANHYIMTLKYNGSEWVITIKINPSELQWDALHNSIRLVSPDGDAVYDAVFNVTYYDVPWILDYDGWYSIPNTSSEIYVTNTAGAGYIEYRFR